MAGLLVALTPMVFHIGSSVNPNGVEMAGRHRALGVGRRVDLGGRDSDRPKTRTPRRASPRSCWFSRCPASPLILLLIFLVLLILVDRPTVRALVPQP